MNMRAVSTILLLITLAGCGAPTAGEPTIVAQQAAAPPSATIAPSATIVPSATAIQAVIVTAEPTATTTPTPSVVPSPTVIQAVLVAPPGGAPAAPVAPAQAPAQPQELRYATIQTDDGFVAVREQPTTSSRELARLSAGTVVVCTEIVRGATLFGSNQWAKCPSVGGYIFAPLLQRTSAAPAAPAAQPSDNDAIIAAVRAYLDGRGSTYQRVERPCSQDGYGLATVVISNDVEPGLAALKREGQSWTVIYYGPGNVLLGGQSSIGLPENFSCQG